MKDIEGAIGVAELAVKSTLEDHSDRAKWLNNLGSKFDRRYERTGEMNVQGDLEEAIRVEKLLIN
jgi:hypothetical protein